MQEAKQVSFSVFELGFDKARNIFLEISHANEKSLKVSWNVKFFKKMTAVATPDFLGDIIL